MPFDLFGGAGAMPGLLPKKPATIELGFAGLYPGAGGTQTASLPTGGGFQFKPTDYQNVTPFEPAPKPAPGEDWQIQPRQGEPLQLGGQGKMQPMYTRDEAGGMEPPAQRPGPFTTPDEARGIQARMAGANPGQMGPSYEQRVYGQDYDANKGPNSAANIILRAKQGDQKASNMLWQMSGQDRTAYVRAMETGTLPYQLEDQARNRAWANEDADRNFKFGMAERGMGLEEQKQRAREEQFKVVQAYQVEKDKLDNALRNRQSELQKRILALQETDPNRQLGQFKVDAIKAANAAADPGTMSPVTAGLLGLPTANQQESQALDLDLKRAQVELAKQQLGQQGSGAMGPLELRKTVQAASNRAQQLLDADPTMAPDEAQRRAAQELDVPAESVPVPQYGSSVGSYQKSFQSAGFENDKAALGYVIDRMVKGDGAWTVAKDPNNYLRNKAPEIVRELVKIGIPAPAAAKAVAQNIR